MIKTYYARSYTLYSYKGTVNIGGESKVVSVVFNQPTSQKGTAFYTTNKEEEQLLIEQSSDFQRGAIFIVYQPEETQQPTKTETKESEQEIKQDVQHAREYKDRADLYNQLSALLPDKQITKKSTEAQLLALAKENNLVFTRK